MPPYISTSPLEGGPASDLLLARGAGTRDHSWDRESADSLCIDLYSLTPSDDLPSPAPTCLHNTNKKWCEASRICLPISSLPCKALPLLGRGDVAEGHGRPWMSWVSGSETRAIRTLRSFWKAQESREVCSAISLTSVTSQQELGPSLWLWLPQTCCVAFFRAGSLALRCSLPSKVGADPVVRPSLLEAGPASLWQGTPKSQAWDGKRQLPSCSRILSHADHEATPRVLTDRVGDWGTPAQQREEDLSLRPDSLWLFLLGGKWVTYKRHRNPFQTVPHRHSAPDEGLWLKAKNGNISGHWGDVLKPALKQLWSRTLSCSLGFPATGPQGRGACSELVLGPNCSHGTIISSAHEEKAPEVAGLFLACLVFPLAQPEYGHCLREENAHPARPENSTLLPSGVHMLDCIDLLRGDWLFLSTIIN